MECGKTVKGRSKVRDRHEEGVYDKMMMSPCFIAALTKTEILTRLRLKLGATVCSTLLFFRKGQERENITYTQKT